MEASSVPGHPAVYANHKRKQALHLFVESNLLPMLNTSVSTVRRQWKAALLILAFIFGVLAAARPAWNPIPQKLERQGRDVVLTVWQDITRLKQLKEARK